MTRRPAVLRALVDLFAMREDPGAEEVERFRELAMRILPDAGPRTRMYVAARLSRHAAAPAQLLRALAQADPECAALIAEHARSFPVGDQIALAREGDLAIACALARRTPLSEKVADALIARNEPAVTQALAENAQAEISRAAVTCVQGFDRPDRALAGALDRRVAEPASSASTFLSAPEHERARVIVDARRNALGSSPRILRDEAVLERLVELSCAGDWPGFIEVLSARIAASPDALAPLVKDRGGEPLALLLALLGADQSEAVRVFLTCDPAISHSFTRVRALSDIAVDTPATAAAHLVFAMSGVRPRISTAPGAAIARNASASRREAPVGHVPQIGERAGVTGFPQALRRNGA